MNHQAMTQAAGQARGAMIGTGVSVSAESEVEREMRRLGDAALSLEAVVGQCWERMGRAGVLAPPPASKEGSGHPVEVASSQLGNTIQNRALEVELQANRLRDLMAALCI